MLSLKKTSFVLIFWLTLVNLSSAQEIVILGNAETYPKIGLRNERPEGILVDILEYVDERMPENLRIELYPWKRAYNYAQSSNMGGIIGISKTPERLNLFDFSHVLYYDEVILVVKKGNEFDFKGYEDLRGLTVGACRDSSFGSRYEKAKDTFTLFPDSSVEQRLRLLLAERIDVAIINPGKLALISELSKIPDLSLDQFSIIDKPMEIDANYLAFRKSQGMTDFLKRFNIVVDEGMNNGELKKISNAINTSLYD